MRVVEVEWRAEVEVGLHELHRVTARVHVQLQQLGVDFSVLNQLRGASQCESLERLVFGVGRLERPLVVVPVVVHSCCLQDALALNKNIRKAVVTSSPLPGQ